MRKIAAPAPAPSNPAPSNLALSNPAAGNPAQGRTIVSRVRRGRQPVRVRPGGLNQSDIATETGTAVPIGPAVIELLAVAHRSDVPVLLIGPHGIGKSEIMAAAAEAIGGECVSRDISLMEPSDILGMPKIENGATTYFPPDFLPRDPAATGFLVFEELNRAPRYVAACTIELLTSRRLGSYRLPRGILPVACINPTADGYHVDRLDAALMSRFMKIEVCAAVGPWVAWAQENGVHEKVIEYVEMTPNSLDESKGGSNPRSWTYASRTLLAAGAETLERSPDTIVTALNGLIGPIHTTSLLRLILGTERPLTPAQVVDDWRTSRSIMRRWIREGRLDLLTASMRAVLQWLRPDGVAEQLRQSISKQLAIRSFVRELGGDLSEQATACLLELGYTHLIPAAAKTAAP